MINRIVVRTLVVRCVCYSAASILSLTMFTGCREGSTPSPSPSKPPGGNGKPQIAQVISPKYNPVIKL